MDGWVVEWMVDDGQSREDGWVEGWVEEGWVDGM